MQREFCYLCGSKLKIVSDSHWHCSICKQDYYANPKPCVEISLFNSKGEILLSLRGHEPFKGKYDLPGGFVDFNETAEEAIAREIKEELDIDPEQYTEPEYLTSYHADYPWGKEVYRNIILEYFAIINDNVEVKALDDVEAVRWILPSDVDDEELSIPQLPSVIEEAAKLFAKYKREGKC